MFNVHPRLDYARPTGPSKRGEHFGRPRAVLVLRDAYRR
jgi:hypothetical protein